MMLKRIRSTLSTSFNFLKSNFSTKTSQTSTDVFLEKRDFLKNKVGKYEEAYHGFQWPEKLVDFNWAHDYFDVTAKNNQKKHALGQPLHFISLLCH